MKQLSDLISDLKDGEILESLYETEEKKMGTLGKLTLASGQMIGNSLGTKTGMYVATGYAISKEVYTLITAQQIYSIPSLVLEFLAIVGTFSLTGRRLGRYVTGKTLDFFGSLLK